MIKISEVMKGLAKGLMEFECPTCGADQNYAHFSPSYCDVCGQKFLEIHKLDPIYDKCDDARIEYHFTGRLQIV